MQRSHITFEKFKRLRRVILLYHNNCVCFPYKSLQISCVYLARFFADYLDDNVITICRRGVWGNKEKLPVFKLGKHTIVHNIDSIYISCI